MTPPGTTPPDVTVVELRAADTHAIRRSVLRDGTASDAVVFDGDDSAGTFHLGAALAGEIVAVSSWMVRRYPDLPAHEAHQLRGMATLPTVRGTGIGARVLAAGLGRAREAGSTVVWARARVLAVPFYERHGFGVRGVEYVDLTTGLPHRDLVKFL